MKTQYRITWALVLGLGLSTAALAWGGGPRGQWLEQYDTDQDGQMSPAERQAARAAHFQTADQNLDGALSLEEWQAIRASRQAERFQKMDSNADGLLSAAEFQAGHPGGRADMAANLFGLADSDKNGSLTAAEFAALHDNPQARAWRHFSALDANGDGQVTAEEFANAKPPRNGRGRHGGPDN